MDSFSSVSQHLDAALTLRQLLQKLQAIGMSRSLCHGRELAEQDAFGLSLDISIHIIYIIQSIN